MVTQATITRTAQPAAAASRRRIGKRARRFTAQAVAYLLLTLGGFVMALPFFWLVSSSLKIPQQIFILPPKWIPAPVRWQNYADIFTMLPFATYTQNTMIIVVGATLGQLVTGTMGAYAFARLRWPGRDLFFAILMSTMMLPAAVTMIPRFIIFKSLRMLNTFWPLILPYWLGGGAFHVFLLRQFFLTIPTELEDAGRIDGASTYTTFTRIMLPLCGPPLAVVAIFGFLHHWNDFMGPLIYLSASSKRTLALGIQSLQGLEWGRDNTELLMAAGLVMVLPAIILFVLAQDIFVQGIALTGIKG